MSGISVRQIVTFACAGAVLLLARPMWPTYVAGCALAAAGIAVRIWGCGHLRKNKDLITSGPYAHVQHPLYLGTFLIALGAIVAAGATTMPALLIWTVLGPLFLAAFFGYYLPKKRRVEGARLAERFPNEYPAFAEAVPTFVPSLRGYGGGDAQPWSASVFFRNHEWQMDALIVAVFVVIALAPRVFSWT